jgi:hypothetical protein
MLDSWEKQTMPVMILKNHFKKVMTYETHSRVISNFYFEKCFVVTGW